MIRSGRNVQTVKTRARKPSFLGLGGQVILHAQGWLLRWILPGSVLAIVSLATFSVWQSQVLYQRSLVERHTRDTAEQLAKRLDTMMTTTSRSVTVAGQRWSRDVAQGASRGAAGRTLFEDVATSIIEMAPDVDLVAFVSADGRAQLISTTSLTMQERADEADELLAAVRDLLADAARQTGVTLSPPIVSGDAGLSVLAALPLDTNRVPLGFLVARLPAETLARECFDRSLLREFDITLADVTNDPERGVPIRSTLAAGHGVGTATALAEVALGAPATGRVVDFRVRNRTWRLAVVDKGRGAHSGWSTDLLVPLLGGAMALGLAAVVLMLGSRITMWRAARDAALEQIERRREMEEALRFSEERYRDVFASASDGLLVVESGRHVLEANAAAAAICGCDSLVLLGGGLEEWLAEQARGAFDDFFDCLTASGQARTEVVIERRATSERLDVELRGTRLHHDPHRRFLVLLTDVTERKRALERQASLSRRVLQAHEEERTRLSREVHDELGQLLAAIRLELGWFKKRIDSDSEVDMDMFAEAVRLVERAADEARRICRGLRPPLLDDLGLAAAVHNLVREFEARAQLTTELTVDGADDKLDVPRELALCTYRILQESLTNVMRHARAKQIKIDLKVNDDGLELCVRDDGAGFNAEKLSHASGFGLDGMRERARLVDGHVEVSSAEGQGTRVVFRAPILASTEGHG